MENAVEFSTISKQENENIKYIGDKHANETMDYDYRFSHKFKGVTGTKIVAHTVFR